MAKVTRKTTGYDHRGFVLALHNHWSAGELRRRRARELSESLKALGSVVYFLKYGPYVKIGYTSDLHMRLRTLRKPTTDVLAVVPGSRPEESEMHKRFAKSRVINELFEATPDLVSFINEVRERAGVHTL